MLHILCSIPVSYEYRIAITHTHTHTHVKRILEIFKIRYSNHNVTDMVSPAFQ